MSNIPYHLETIKNTHDIKLARCTGVQFDTERGLTCWVYLDYEDGCSQGFGGYLLDHYDKEKKRRVGTACGHDFLVQLTQIFQVADLHQLKGKMMYAIFEKPISWGSTIVGLAPLYLDTKGLSDDVDKFFLVSKWRKEWGLSE